MKKVSAGVVHNQTMGDSTAKQNTQSQPRIAQSKTPTQIQQSKNKGNSKGLDQNAQIIQAQQNYISFLQNQSNQDNYDSSDYALLHQQNMGIQQALLNESFNMMDIRQEVVHSAMSTTAKGNKKGKIQLKGNASGTGLGVSSISNRCITPHMQTKYIELTQSKTPQGHQQIQPGHKLFNQSSIQRMKKEQPMLNIDAIEDNESQYCLEQLISPNFQPPSSTISMQKRLQKQQQSASSSTRFKNSQHFFAATSNTYGQMFYSNIMKKNSSRSNGLDSPSVHEMSGNIISQSKLKHQQKKSGNPNKIMNDSLNMISKSRNKFLNKSFQKNSGSSGTRVVQNTSQGGDSSKMGSSNQHQSLKKFQRGDTSLKKLNTTASYDILALQNESDQLDQSYGRFAPDFFQRGAHRSPHAIVSNNPLQSSGSNCSNTNPMLHHQLSNVGIMSTKKLSTERDTSAQNINAQLPGGNQSMKKGTFRFNIKSSLGFTGTLNTPLGRSNYVTHHTHETNESKTFVSEMLNHSHSESQNMGGGGNSASLQTRQNVGDHSMGSGSYQQIIQQSNRVSPISSNLKKQLIFNSKATNKKASNESLGSKVITQSYISTKAEQLNQLQAKFLIQNGLDPAQMGMTGMLGINNKENSSPTNNQQRFRSNQNIQQQQQQFVRPFEFQGQDDMNNQLKPQLQNIDQYECIDPQLFYQQCNGILSTTSQQSNEAQHMNVKKSFKVPKISSRLAQQQQHQQNNQLQEMRQQMPQSQLGMRTHDMQKYPLIKRSMTPSGDSHNFSMQQDTRHRMQFNNLQFTPVNNDLNQTVSSISLYQQTALQHNQTFTAEDVSFNIDCMQQFHISQQQQHHLNQQQISHTMERPVTVGDIKDRLPIAGPTDTFNIQPGARIPNAFGGGHPNQINEYTTTTSECENLETSRFSSTLESHIKQLQNNNEVSQNIPQHIDMINKSLKVAPNAHQIKQAIMNNAKKKKPQQQFLNKMKSDHAKHNNNLQNVATTKDYLKQLKMEMDERKNQQIMRNHQLQTLDSQLNAQSTNSSIVETLPTQATNNVFIVNQIPPVTVISQSAQKSMKKQVKPQFITHQKQVSKAKQSSLKKLRDRSADPMLTNNQNEDYESSSSSGDSQTQSPSHLISSSRSSSFIESSRIHECRDCLKSKNGSEQCSQCADSKMSRLSKLGGTRQQHRIKKKVNKEGRIVQLKIKDSNSKQVFKIEAPNNIFFNDQLSLTQPTGVNGDASTFYHRGRQMKRTNNMLNEEEGGDEMHQHNLIPIVKRNLTPDDHLSKQQADSYLLVDNQGQPKKIYIKRNIPTKTNSPGKDKLAMRTVDYDSNLIRDGYNPNQFSTIQNQKTDELQKTVIKRKMTNGQTGGLGESLICCLSTKSHRQQQYDNHSQGARSANSTSRCILQ